MIGIYENFPEVIHGIMNFSCLIPAKDFQKLLLHLLQRFNANEEDIDLPEFILRKTQVELEVGIADGLTFNYLDKESLRHYVDKISEDALSILDLLFVVRYYINNSAGRRPLKFDYYLVRFAFGEGEIKISVHHERGPMHLMVEELVKLIYEKINKELISKEISPLTPISSKTIGSGDLSDDLFFNS